ncbi:hypothetical protein AB0J38_45830 [Streptomyces sp. NPDC050095]|uniref:hypothetical protein n=1 Tax=unclassified Streptomyces TaxID=2593676 RepID=UPI00342148BC
MARHAAPKNSTAARRTLLRAGLTVTAAGAAVAAGGGAASAATPLSATQSLGLSTPVGDFDSATPAQAVTKALHASTAGGLAPAKRLQLDPLAGTGVDPLDNSLGTQVADFKPVSTASATSPLTSGGSLDDLPVLGAATGVLPG